MVNLNHWLVVITFIVVLIAPGLLLIRLLHNDTHSPWRTLVQLPEALTISLGLLSPLALLVIELGLSLFVLGSVTLVITLALVGLLIFKFVRQLAHAKLTANAPTVRLHSPISLLLAWAAVLAAVAVFYHFYMTISTWTSGDTWYLQYIQAYIDTPTQVPFDWRASWWILQALLDYLSGIQPLDAFSFYLPPLLMILSLLATYAFAVELFQNPNSALLATLLQMLFYVSSINSHDWLGRGFFDRIVEDKFLIWLIILPVTLLLTVRYFRTGNQRLLLPLALSFSALTFIHPIGLVQGALAVGSFGLVHLVFNRRRQMLFQVLLVGVVLPFVFVTVPWLQSRTIWGRQPGEAVEESRAFNYAFGSSRNPDLLDLFQTRLWVLSASDDHYVAHPHLIAHPLILLAILLMPLLLFNIRRSLAAQFLVSNMVATLLLLYTPGLTPLLGRLITPWLLYRLVWALPIALVLAYVTQSAYERLKRILPSLLQRQQTGFALFFLLLVAGLGWLLAGYIYEGVSFLQERRILTMTPAERDVLDYLPEIVDSGETIIARDDWLTYTIPAFVAAKTLYLNATYAPQARADVASFYQTRLLTPATLQLLERWQVKFIIIERDRPLAFQLARLPAYFDRRYQNQTYALYEVLPRPAGDPILAGNEALLQGQFERAEAAYRQALVAEPANSAAGYGLGLSLQAQNQIEVAREVWQQLLAGQPSNDAQNRPDDLPVWLALARLYQQTGQFDTAQTELTQARALWPASLEAAELLGDVYLARGRTDAALGAYNQAVLQPPAVAPGQYHLALAELYRRKGLTAQAEAEYQTVIKLDSLPAIGLRPDGLLGVRNTLFDFRTARLAQAHTALAQLQIQAGNSAAAEAEYRQALTEVTNYQPAYTGLANLFRAGEHPDKAIDLYRLAGRRNPNLAWPHLELGRLYLDRIKEDLAP
ncbi:MAG: hypothetical protein FOGNACKC_00092 [Anaerolineae bacterium]|nr:hypothetical protein [Anaerolineae bacterium]